MSGKNTRIGVIGAGVMGRALIRGMQSAGFSEIWAAARSETSCQRAADELGIPVSTKFQENLADTDLILLAVKPAQVKAILKDLRKSGVKSDAIIVSVAAGLTLKQLESFLDTGNPVIRAMPNTPCIVGQGVIALCGGNKAKKEHLALAAQIFQTSGKTFVLEEKHFDAVTGLSGSAPAYFYLIMEALADGGVRVGLPRELALEMVVQAMLGSAVMVQKTGRHPASLRDDVTTPAGCTIGALLVMEDGRIRSILARAIEEAARIAGELGNVKK